MLKDTPQQLAFLAERLAERLAAQLPSGYEAIAREVIKKRVRHNMLIVSRLMPWAVAM